MKKVYLGGTCNDSTWRNNLISKLDIDYFNPVVDDWTPDCQQEELKQRKICDFLLYTITPKMTGVYSIAEVVDDSNKNPKKTLLCILSVDGYNSFDKGQMMSLKAVSDLVENNGAIVFNNLDDVANYLNNN